MTTVGAVRARWAAAATGLALLFLRAPGLHAAGIETLVMPGRVAQAHAETEGECKSCHQAFKKGEQNVLCLDCHEEVAADLTAGRGLHGRSPDVEGVPCAQCHTEHKGRDADIVPLDVERFDHDLTDFELRGAHAATKCEECHAGGGKFREAPTPCNDCHADDDVHEGHLGAGCADCHDEERWTEAAFDHDRTDFGLRGGHRDVACLDCHADRTFTHTPVQCSGCHRDDDVHEGRNGPRCERCHGVESWEATIFDHARDTDFALAGAHAELECAACHTGDPYEDQLAQECNACHAEDDEHRGHFGPACADCHTASAWSEIVFDHDRDTDYRLRGAHRPLRCESCHEQPIHEVEPSGECHACHRDDDVHEGQQGSACAECHDETSWTEEVAFDHDLAGFPLLGAHADAACEECHETQAFKDAAMECDACHAEEDVHTGRLGRRCERCHNPVAWESWSFDHEGESGYALDGAHAAAACEACHDVPLDRYEVADRACVVCHRPDDVHRGEFGNDCERCHTTESFADFRGVR